MNKKCLYCKTSFEPNIKKGIWKRQKHCSAECRNKYWKKINPERFEYHRHRGYMKYKKTHTITCKFCKKEIPFNKRKSGKTLCSKECKNKQFLLVQKKHRDNTSFKFKKFKESLGCYRCKYNKYGGSLDFHHIDPSKKIFRITSTHWVSQSTLFLTEFKKCVLVCKNCHNELHHILRENKNKYIEEMKLHIKHMNKKKIVENGDVTLDG